MFYDLVYIIFISLPSASDSSAAVIAGIVVGGQWVGAACDTDRNSLHGLQAPHSGFRCTYNNNYM